MNGVRASYGTASGDGCRTTRHPEFEGSMTAAGRRSRHCRVAQSLLGSAALAAVCGLLSGCGFDRLEDSVNVDAGPDYYQVASTQIEYPDVETPINDDVLTTAPPLTVIDESDIEFQYVTLQDAVHNALMNSRVLRDLGGVVLRSPDDVDTSFDVALQELDPRFGVAAALSEFDASFATSAFHDNNDRALNNQFFGGGTRRLRQDTSTIESQITKRAATGTELTVLNHTEYDANNAPGNFFGSAWTTWIDTEVRHPLLQGSGTTFNRIAGPSNSPANINGVVLARLRTDTTLADFEMSVRDFVSNVENAYWDLYFAYRDLDARIVARDNALRTWNRIHALYEAGRVGGEAEKEAQAREQYFRFQEQVQNALSGRLEDGTRTNNGTAGGSFRGNGGVLSAERRLRLLMGLPINDGRILRPEDEPILAQVIFDWDAILVESLTRRAELRRQKWIIKQREQELIASRNFLLPSLDLVGRYRWRGLGRNFLKQHSNSSPASGDPEALDGAVFNNAWENLLDGDFQEWQLGFELSMPIGNRRAHAAVEYAELRLSRERAVLHEQEREVVTSLSSAIAELNRAWAVLETAEDRRIAATEQLGAVQAAFEADKVNFDVLLDSQRRFLDAETNYHRALVEYSIGVRNVHFEKGSLLDYNEIFLTEDIWPMQAYSDALRRKENEIPAEWLHGFVTHPTSVSVGPYNQNMMPGDAAEWEGSTFDPIPLQADDGEFAPIELQVDERTSDTSSGLTPAGHVDSELIEIPMHNVPVEAGVVFPREVIPGLIPIPGDSAIQPDPSVGSSNSEESSQAPVVENSGGSDNKPENSVDEVVEFDVAPAQLPPLETLEVLPALTEEVDFVEVAPLPPADLIEVFDPAPIAPVAED